MSKANEVTFMHTFETIEACREHVRKIFEPAIVISLFNGERSMYTFCHQAAIDTMQEELNALRATYFEIDPSIMQTIKPFTTESLKTLTLDDLNMLADKEKP